MKRCTQCGKDKSLDHFYDKKRSKVRSDGSVHKWMGKYAKCKECHDVATKKARIGNKDWYSDYRKSNKDRISMLGKLHYVRTKMEWVKLIATEKRLECMDCGYNDHWAALDFHHENPDDKEGLIHALMKAGIPNHERWEIMKKEINKCVILCSNCHRKRHAKYNFLDEGDLEKMMKNWKSK